ncbi:MAG: hypothetical protein HFH94_16215 [Lachnospiraceae bacterium]|nr:FtsX-like permease family protein [uncultured Acetatifactor sp.]MCI9221239.1 hypothetical protein [Lachnospiraceae bacterium]
MNLLSWVAEVSILLIAVGIIGILLIFLDKREKDIQISVWVGAVQRKLYVELFLEVLSLCLLAGGISMLLAYFMADGLSTSQYSVRMSPWAAGVIAAVCLVIAWVTCTVVWVCAKAEKKLGKL